MILKNFSYPFDVLQHVKESTHSQGHSGSGQGLNILIIAPDAKTNSLSVEKRNINAPFMEAIVMSSTSSEQSVNELLDNFYLKISIFSHGSC